MTCHLAPMSFRLVHRTEDLTDGNWQKFLQKHPGAKESKEICTYKSTGIVRQIYTPEN